MFPRFARRRRTQATKALPPGMLLLPLFAPIALASFASPGKAKEAAV
jgi:hypothetical protein